jgi:toxin ParE1/3/4
MKRPVTWSQDALNDFKQLIDYIAARNPDAAMRVADRIFESCDLIGEIASGHRGRVNGTYEKIIPKSPYIVSYEITPQHGGEVVSILRIIHSSRDRRKNHWPN